jgi:hypothetical protein
MQVHKMMIPTPPNEADKKLLREVLSEEDFMTNIVQALGAPVKVKIDEEKNLVEFHGLSHKKTMWIDVLLAYTKGEVH